MQSVPTYYPPNFAPTSPYPKPTSAATNAPSATANADATGDGTAATMSVPTPPVMTSTLGQNLMEADSAAPPAAEPTKRNQVKNACSKFVYFYTCLIISITIIISNLMTSYYIYV